MSLETNNRILRWLAHVLRMFNERIPRNERERQTKGYLAEDVNDATERDVCFMGR